jgi:5-aminolevulinate synthase
MGGYIAGSAARGAISVRSYAAGLHLHHRPAAGNRCRVPAPAIRHLKESQVERFAHQERVRRLRSLLDRNGIPHMPNPSHIVPVMVGDAAKCKWISDLLLDNFGIYVQPINYPTVPKKTERLRITPTPLHTDADIDHLVGALHSLWSRCALARAVA